MTVDLVVMRHATAEPFGTNDRDRHLTAAGQTQARECGAWLAEQVPGFSRVLVSAAVRTQETWQEVASGAGWRVEDARSDEVLYHAGPEEVLEILRGLQDLGPALVIGHNPTVATVSHLLHDGLGAQGAMQRLAQGFAPSTAALFESPGPWAELEWGLARLHEVRLG